jgi:ABC-type phosphate transport system substrate-binding protein
MIRLLFIFCVVLLAVPVGAEERTANVIAVVVPANQSIEALHLTPSKLKLVYLRKQLYWPDGKRIEPVNLQTEHPLRVQFSQAVLGSLPAEQISYWNGLYFNGIRPPYSVNSEEAVLRYLEQTPRAIGYVEVCKVDARVNALLWLVNGQITTQKPETDCAENDN